MNWGVRGGEGVADGIGVLSPKGVPSALIKLSIVGKVVKEKKQKV